MKNSLDRDYAPLKMAASDPRDEAAQTVRREEHPFARRLARATASLARSFMQTFDGRPAGAASGTLDQHTLNDIGVAPTELFQWEPEQPRRKRTGFRTLS